MQNISATQERKTIGFGSGALRLKPATQPTPKPTVNKQPNNIKYKPTRKKMPNETEKKQDKTLILPSGKTATIKPFKGKHISIAQVQAGSDQSKYLFSIISQCIEIEGNFVAMEDLDEMDGADVLALMGEFGESFQ